MNSELRVLLGFTAPIAVVPMNLDDPAGFAFDKGGVWGAHVGGGFTF